MTKRLRTVVIGFGQVADTLGDDPRMRRYFREASHAEVLSIHPSFDWDAVVDPSESARQRAREKWGVTRTASDIAGLGEEYAPDVAVITAPPATRLAAINALPSLSGLLVEKPLGHSMGEAGDFAKACADRGLAVQVHFWRRAVHGFRALAAGELAERIGTVQGAFAIYGRGLFNNGSHLVDLARMLLGEIADVRALGAADHNVDLSGDFDVPFALRLISGAPVTVFPVKFQHYREVGLDIWGTTGRLALMQESLSVTHYPRTDNRGLVGEFEIASDKPRQVNLPVAESYRAMYDNLAASLMGKETLYSDEVSALRTMAVLDAISRSVQEGGRTTQIA